MKKKQILFLCSNMSVGGFQKSLVSLLQCFDYDKYDVDLLLLNPSGIFMDLIPKQVKILDNIIEPKYFDSCGTAVKEMLRKHRIGKAVIRILSGIAWTFDKGYGAILMSKAVPKLKKHYDAAIDYNGQHLLYYMIDSVYADKKITYFHSDYNKWSYYKKADKIYYKKADSIVTVSDLCVKSIQNNFPENRDKVYCIENIISKKTVNIFKKNSNTYKDGFGGIRLVSVGRVCKDKGIDLASGALKMLLKDGYNVKWYEVGPIENQEYIDNLVSKYQINDRLVFLGPTNNPYDYMRNADIVVHPSRFEGKAVAVEEAKILNKPIVATNFSTVYNQIENERTGLIVDMNAESLYNGIKRMIDDNELRNRIIETQKKECKGNENEVEKLYKLIEG